MLPSSPGSSRHDASSSRIRSRDCSRRRLVPPHAAAIEASCAPHTRSPRLAHPWHRQRAPSPTSIGCPIPRTQPRGFCLGLPHSCCRIRYTCLCVFGAKLTRTSMQTKCWSSGGGEQQQGDCGARHQPEGVGHHRWPGLGAIDGSPTSRARRRRKRSAGSSCRQRRPARNRLRRAHGAVLRLHLRWICVAASSLQPRMLLTVDEDLKPVPVPVRVGQAVMWLGRQVDPRRSPTFRRIPLLSCLQPGSERNWRLVHPPDVGVGGICNSEEEPGVPRGVRETP